MSVQAAAPTETGAAIYRRAYAIDAQCFAGQAPAGNVPFLTPSKVEALRTSGITALGWCVSTGTDPKAATPYLAVKEVIEKWDAFIAQHSDVLMKVVTSAQLDQAKKSGKVGLIYNFQHPDCFGGSLAQLKTYVDMGVRQMQLVHNRRNFIADTCQELTNAGLSTFGREVVEALNAQRVLIDLSHAGELSSLETVLQSTAPVLYSHSGCFALCPHPRNVSDRNIKAVADKGGLFCVYNQSGWLTRDPVISMDHYLAHVKRVIDLTGEDHVGMGTDQDAVDMTAMRPDEVTRHQRTFDADFKTFPYLTWKVRHMRVPELSHPHRLLHLSEALVTAGYTPRVVEKILGGNYARLFRDVVG